MIVERLPGFIKFQLEPKDWTWDALGFIKALKAQIPIEARTYNDQTKTWEVVVDFKQTFYDLKRKFFTDENQTELSI